MYMCVQYDILTELNAIVLFKWFSGGDQLRQTCFCKSDVKKCYCLCGIMLKIKLSHVSNAQNDPAEIK